MFHESTQKGLWFFENEQMIADVRNAKYKDIPSISADEEYQLVLFYDRLVREFCDTCKPRIPRATMATACAYLKRLYLRHSVIDYPIEMYYRTCVYLACKVDEFNLTSDDFISNFISQGVTESKAQELVQQILKTELKLISLLQFSLIVYSPYRPLDGFLIAMKNFYINVIIPKPTDEKAIVTEIDSMSAKADSFILWSLATDVCFLFSPSQIALASVLYASKGLSFDFLKFLEHLTGGSESTERFNNLYSKLCVIVNNVKALKLPNKDYVDSILRKINDYLEVQNSGL